MGEQTADGQGRAGASRAGRIPVRRAVDDIARWLFEPLLAPRPEGSSWRVVAWDAEQGLCLTLDRKGVLLLVELEDRDDARDCYARTARFNVTARRVFDEGAPLGPGEHKLVMGVVELVRRREGGLPDLTAAPTRARSASRDLLVDRVLIPEGRGTYYVNPYVGCTIGCSFCYVEGRADLSRRLEGLPHVPWGRYVDVKVNAPEVLARELPLHPPGPVRMSPILTDPYQPIERKARITRRCLEVMVGTGYTPLILTRAARITDDLDVLTRFDAPAIGLSIPTDDDSVRRLFEPHADPVDARIEALRALHQAGCHTFVVIQPMLPMDPDRLVAQVAPYVRAARVDRMHFIESVRPTYAAHGLEHAATQPWFDQTRARLLAGFASHGVAVDEHDDLLEAMHRHGG